MNIDGATVKLSSKEIHVLVQALRIASEDERMYEYCNRAYINQLNGKLSSAK